jgi:ATP-dependent HslUV protease ATP-binding subunit HslU
MKTEGVTLEFTPEAVRKISYVAAEVNQRTEDIGARRLYTIMEKLLEDISFEAPERGGETIVIDAGYVENRLRALVKDEDLSRYIL